MPKRVGNLTKVTRGKVSRLLRESPIFLYLKLLKVCPHSIYTFTISDKENKKFHLFLFIPHPKAGAQYGSDSCKCPQRELVEKVPEEPPPG